MRRKPLQSPDEISRIVGRKADLRTRLHDASKLIQHRHLYEPSLVMTRLRPRIGKEDKHPADARLGKRVNDVTRVFGIETDIVGPIRTSGQLRKELGDTGDVRLGSDDSDIGVRFGLPKQMLAAAEADLQPNIGDARFGKVRSCVAARF